MIPYLWMLLGSLSFAVMATQAHALAQVYDWQFVTVARTVLPLVFAAGFARAAGARLVFWRPRILWLRSIAGSLSILCTFFALHSMPVADVLTLTNMFPIWVALLAWPVLGQRPTLGVWVAVASGIVGVALIEQPHLADGNYVAFVALAGSFTTAIAMLGLHRLHGLHPWAIVTHFSGVAVAFALASFFWFERTTESPPWPDATGWLLLLGVGTCATIGQLGLTRAFASGPPSKVSVVALTQVVFALGFDLLLWHRAVEPSTLVGMGLVIAPTAWILTCRM